MPSQVAHALFADSLLAALSVPGGILKEDRYHRYLGAQGPDMFLHNHRRRPRGIYYGTILHRKGIAGVVSRISPSVYGNDHLLAYLLGWISHVFLDRAAHPYINFHSGWHGVPDSDPERRHMHAFLERIIDVQILWRNNRVTPDRFGFHDFLRPYQEIPEYLLHALVTSLRRELNAARIDDEIEHRIKNAYLDMMGFYAFTDHPPRRYFREARRRERNGDLAGRWLSIIHPPHEWIPFDALNSDRRWWRHPCREGASSNLSFLDLWNEGLSRATVPAKTLLSIWRDGPDPLLVKRLYAEIGEENLNDGISTDTGCVRTYAEPLPLLSLYKRIKTGLDVE